MENDNFLHTFHSQITEKTGFRSKSLYFSSGKLQIKIKIVHTCFPASHQLTTMEQYCKGTSINDVQFYGGEGSKMTPKIRTLEGKNLTLGREERGQK